MSYICEICGKGTSVGRRQRHRRGVAGKRWRKRAQVVSRLFKPNLQRKTLIVAEKKQKMLICTKCLKKIKKDGTIKNYSKIAVA